MAAMRAAMLSTTLMRPVVHKHECRDSLPIKHQENAMIDEPTHHSTTDHVRERAHESVDRLAERAAPAEERIREGAAEVSERMRTTSQQAWERSEDMLDTVTGYVRENPITSVCLAFAAGTLLSALRRRD
jgi:ElaB/YqjD/DUF883 family membrane-anchored ribosome-binding protein